MEDATIAEPGLIGGIIMPRLQHRWLLHSISILTPEENDLVRLQLVANHFAYNQNTAFNSRFGFDTEERHSLLFVVEDPILSRTSYMMEPIIQKLCDATEPFDIIIDTPGWTIDNVNLIERRATYRGCKLSRYTYTQDYAVSETCKYPMEFTVKSVSYSHPDINKFIASTTKK